jgi:hypothetical protein
MKKYGKTVFVVVVIAVLCVGYFFYLTHRGSAMDSTQKAVDNQELSYLTTFDIENNYPQSPKEVIKLYTRITMAYYKSTLTDKQIETLGGQARKLFDTELKGTQTDKEFYKALKQDIQDYNDKGRYVADAAIDDSTVVNYTKFQGKKYATLYVTYSVRENGSLELSKTKFTLRQDSDGNWKILFWELAS